MKRHCIGSARSRDPQPHGGEHMRNRLALGPRDYFKDFDPRRIDKKFDFHSGCVTFSLFGFPGEKSLCNVCICHCIFYVLFEYLFTVDIVQG